VALPAARGETHEETRADAPEEVLGEPIEGHAAGEARGEAAPEVSEAAPDARPHEERPRRGDEA